MLNRREFIEMGGAACFAAGLAGNLAAGDAKPLEIRRIAIQIGLKKPFKALHFSDTHLTLADERDNERKRKLAADRHRCFPQSERFLAEALAYARAHGEVVLHTGDFQDFVSAANLDAVKRAFAGVDCIAAAGNHEYSQYVGEAKEDAAYKAKSCGRVKAVWPNDPSFCSRAIGGVNFVAFDDAYSWVDADAEAKLKAECAKGLPIVLMCHVPFYTPELFKDEAKANRDRYAYLMGTPKERLANPLPGEPAMRAPGTDAATRSFIAFVEREPLVKAVLCGHLHREFHGPLPGLGAMQYVATGHYYGIASEITFA